ncbi:zinc finger BED domain-containing protein RICESLEEPER 2-like [Telopea speciosissima]|uniref:zinc finger BED domain-containing protein RICESLEEPER 2-like n=1 Tax=Telopea speciosissima TaxID=54955 RepID=UPI001CC7E526|nr:zinc finger BED domain-containing protein RICESLEEPER 2-like [Telopea speciosissima]
MDQNLHLSATASASTPVTIDSATTVNVDTNPSNVMEKDKNEMEKQKESGKGKKDSCVDVELSKRKRRKITSEVWSDFERTVHGDRVTATLDNASTNDVMISHLREWIGRKGALLHNGEIFHVRCTSHILNLIVHDGLVEFRDALAKIRDMVKWINASPSRSEKWGNALAQCKLFNKKGVSLDVPTRWNSTFEMLHNALEVRAAFERLAELDNNFKTLPTEEEWEKCSKIEQCLEVFYDATKHISGTKYPTANFFFKDVSEIHQNLLEWEKSIDTCISSMAFKMRLKFDKYWKNISLFMALGVIFYPRYKMELIVFVMNKIYGDNANYYFTKIQFDVGDIYSEYASTYDDSCPTVSGDASDRVGGNEKNSLHEIPKRDKTNISGEFKIWTQNIRKGQK